MDGTSTFLSKINRVINRIFIFRLSLIIEILWYLITRYKQPQDGNSQLWIIRWPDKSNQCMEETRHKTTPVIPKDNWRRVTPGDSWTNEAFWLELLYRLEKDYGISFLTHSPLTKAFKIRIPYHNYYYYYYVLLSNSMKLPGGYSPKLQKCPGLDANASIAEKINSIHTWMGWNWNPRHG